MATTVSYDHEFPYPYDDSGESYPFLQVQLINPTDPSRTVEVDAHVDSGCGRSLFNGELAAAIGLQFMNGQAYKYSSTSGNGLSARLHQVTVSHPELGRFQLEVGFSEKRIWRNLLGRDFFALIQIGFRERHSTFYVTAMP
jgi:hypothetical protein